MNGEQVLTGMSFVCLFVFLFKLGDENVLKVDSGDGCMTL